MLCSANKWVFRLSIQAWPFRFRYCMQGWVMRFSIHVWVFIFGYLYSGSDFWSGIGVQVLRFRYWGSACRFSIQVKYWGLGLQVFRVWVVQLNIEPEPPIPDLNTWTSIPDLNTWTSIPDPNPELNVNTWHDYLNMILNVSTQTQMNPEPESPNMSAHTWLLNLSTWTQTPEIWLFDGLVIWRSRVCTLHHQDNFMVISITGHCSIHCKMASFIHKVIMWPSMTFCHIHIDSCHTQSGCNSSPTSNYMYI